MDKARNIPATIAANMLLADGFHIALFKAFKNAIAASPVIAKVVTPVPNVRSGQNALQDC